MSMGEAYAFWKHINTCTAHDLVQDIWLICLRVNAMAPEEMHSPTAIQALLRLKPFVMLWKTAPASVMDKRARCWKEATGAQAQR
jgi:hypothetical protein